MSLLPIFAPLGAIALPQTNPPIEGSVFDKDGHYIAYNYVDGSHDRYTYDLSWRMITFEARDGTVTMYSYNPDGSVRTAVVPPVSKSPHKKK